jgi:hypothetical protein
MADGGLTTLECRTGTVAVFVRSTLLYRLGVIAEQRRKAGR